MPWNEKFVNFFQLDRITDNLPHILPATGCREGWIQAEMFRYFHCYHEIDDFWVNEFNYPGYGKNPPVADISTGELENPTMVSELKVIRDDFEYQYAIGFGINSIPNDIDQIYAYHDDDLLDYAVMKDFMRLRNLPSTINKYLIYLFDKRRYDQRPNTQEFRNAIYNIRFSAEDPMSFDSNADQEEDGFWVRIWRIE